MPHPRVALLSLAVAALTLTTLASASSAQTPARPQGVETHDGFFLRLATGAGASAVTIESGSFNLEFSDGTGLGGVLDVAIGGVVWDNLAVHGTALAFTMTNPQASLNGVELPSEESSVFLGLVGIGVTYYVMPLNLYLSGSIGLSQMQITFPESEQTFEAIGEGPAFSAQVGKEWWVSDNWGLGVAGVLATGTRRGNNALGAEVTSNFNAFALLFSATYN